MALQAQRVAFGAQQMIVVAAVRRVAGGAALRKSGLMVHRLLAQIVDVAVAAQADAHCVGLRQAGLVAGVRAVAIRAVAHCAGMRHFGRVDQLGLVVVAGDAKRFGVGLRQHHFSVFGRRVAGIAAFACERRMHELRHQLGRIRLVRIMALHAVRRGEGLVVDAPSASPRPSRRGNPGKAPGADLVRWNLFSGVGSAPVLWVTWQVSQPISSAA